MKLLDMFKRKLSSSSHEPEKRVKICPNCGSIDVGVKSGGGQTGYSQRDYCQTCKLGEIVPLRMKHPIVFPTIEQSQVKAYKKHLDDIHNEEEDTENTEEKDHDKYKQ